MPFSLEEKISSIVERNKRVEADKAWETSKFRRGLIALATYVVVVYFLLLINVPNPFLNALVPTLGFIVSTLSLPFIREWWVKDVYRK
ncbi:Uncharacterised protein [uncultured archaeon]|nr:Uncharacterised protein [uncultured archaeon]